MNTVVSPFAAMEAIEGNPLLIRLLLASIEFAVLAVIMAGVVKLWGGKRPRVAVYLWAIVLVKPLISLVAGTSLPIVSFAATGAEGEVSAQAPRAVENAGSGDAISRAPTEPEVKLRLSAPSEGTAPAVDVRPRTAADDGLRTSVANAASASPHAVAPYSLWDWIAGLWIIGCMIVAAWLVRSRHAAARLVGRGKPASDALDAVYRSIAGELGIHRPPRLRVCDDLPSPALVGVIRPTILIPAWLAEDAAEVGSDVLRWSFRHELTHFKSGDPWLIVLRDIVRAVFFFHPAAWWCGTRLEESIEVACDHGVVADSRQATAYAKGLYELLCRARTDRIPARSGGLFATRTQIGQRVTSLLQGPLTFGVGISKMAIAAVLVFAASAFCVGVGIHDASLAAAQGVLGTALDGDQGNADPLLEGAVMRLGTTRLRQRQGVNGVAFSPDGKHLVSMGWGDSIRFWDVDTGRHVRRLKSPGVTFAVAFSPDGSLLASVGNNHLRLWDLATGEKLYEKETESDRTYSVAFAPDGKSLATAGMGEVVHVWDTKSGELLRQLQTEGGTDAHPVAFSPDGRLLASGSKSGMIRIWSLAEDVPPISIKAHGFNVVSLAFTSDGKALVSGGSRGERRDDRFTDCSEVYLWNVADGSKIHEFDLPIEDLLGSPCLALSADGSTLVTSHLQWIVAWDMKTRDPIRVIPRDEGIFSGGRSHGLAISPDKRFVAAIGIDHKVSLWEVATGNPVFPQHGTHRASVVSVDASPDGTVIVTACEGGEVHLWDAATGRYIRTLVGQKNWTSPIPLRFSSRSVQFMPDGERVLVTAVAPSQLGFPRFLGTTKSGARPFAGIMKIVRVSNGAVEREWALPERPTCAAVSADGGRVAVALGLGMRRVFLDEGEAPEIRVWDLKGRGELPTLEGLERQVQQLRFGVDGATLWSIGEDASICKWNLSTGEELERLSFDGGESLWQTLAVSADLQRAAYGNYVRTESSMITLGQITVIGLEDDGNEWQKPLPAHFPKTSVFSPDNQLLAVSLHPSFAAGDNEKILLLDAANGREMLAFELQDGVVRSLAFSRDGRTLYSGMGRGDVLVWDVSRAYE